MKKISYWFIGGLPMIGIALTLTAFTHSHSTEIFYTENKTSFQLQANYSPKQTAAVAQYIDEVLKPETIFNQQVELDKQVELHDKARFYIKASAGKLLLRLDKTANTKAICERMRKIFKDIAKHAIKPE